MDFDNPNTDEPREVVQGEDGNWYFKAPEKPPEESEGVNQ